MRIIYITSLKNKLLIPLNVVKNTIIRSTEPRNQILKYTLSHLIYDKGNTTDWEKIHHFQ